MSMTFVTTEGLTWDILVSLTNRPFIGRLHDSTILFETGIEQQLAHLMPREGSNGQVYALYGDAAYRQSPWIYQGFLDPERNSPEALVNQTLSVSRMSVEWAYGLVTQKFSHIDFHQSQRVFPQKIGQQYINCTFINVF